MKYIIMLILYSSLTSCYHVYYAPNTLNTPLLSEKGEMRVNALFTSGRESDYLGGELQAAYAILKNWAVMFNAITAGRTLKTDYISRDYIERGSGSYAEFGGGYFKPISKNHQWEFEVYGGFGGGSVKNDYALNDHSQVGLTKFFIQPAIGLKNKYYEFSVGTRLGLINWKVKENNIQHSENDYEKRAMMWIQDKPSFFVLEPGMMFRAGNKNVKAQLGFTLGSSYRSGIFDFVDLTESFNLNVGISYNFHKQK